MTLLTEEQINELKKELEQTPPEQQQEKAKEILSRLTPEQVTQLRGGEGTAQCPYCLIGEGKLQSAVVYEDEKFKAVLEINPANKGHVVLFPKEHIAKTSQLSRLDHEELFAIVQKLDLALHKVFESTNIYISNGLLAGQKFDHAVVHIIPREKEDGVTFMWEPKKVEQKELEDFMKTIRENMPKEEEVKEEQIDADEILQRMPDPETRIP